MEARITDHHASNSHPPTKTPSPADLAFPETVPPSRSMMLSVPMPPPPSPRTILWRRFPTPPSSAVAIGHFPSRKVKTLKHALVCWLSSSAIKATGRVICAHFNVNQTLLQCSADQSAKPPINGSERQHAADSLCVLAAMSGRHGVPCPSVPSRHPSGRLDAAVPVLPQLSHRPNS
ncbi:hypothetical protein BRADI_3g44441v3 [Brachypodium distachyon]|uniref:Uncharacterized protein n=1 Tax=Brachypodium distachyon TaxID=15368 RepID=A0A2K2D370_BRADI|nr:hypothetical protein BRADI_3g44441v3 [Brachypodium distachyon]